MKPSYTIVTPYYLNWPFRNMTPENVCHKYSAYVPSTTTTAGTLDCDCDTQVKPVLDTHDENCTAGR